MKRTTVYILCALLTVGAWTGFSSFSGKGNKTERIALLGSLGTVTVKSFLPATSPLEAYQTASAVQLAFYRNLGNLTVTITKKSGAPVYQNTVNASAGGGLTIGTQGWSAGTYNLAIANAAGGRMEGTFAIE